MEQDRDDCIRPNAYLEIKPQVRSQEQPKCMYSECLDGIGKFRDFEYHIELDPSKAKIQIPHKVVMSVELKLKGKIHLECKA